MTATETAPEEAPESTVPGPKRLQPYQIAIVIRIGVALVTVASGIAASVFQFHDDSSITREVFDNIPAWLKVTFYTVIPIVIVYGTASCSPSV
ncbi:MAG: hypothetical protein R2789_14335 [Microthrixaceae bacterium]